MKSCWSHKERSQEVCQREVVAIEASERAMSVMVKDGRRQLARSDRLFGTASAFQLRPKISPELWRASSSWQPRRTKRAGLVEIDRVHRLPRGRGPQRRRPFTVGPPTSSRLSFPSHTITVSFRFLLSLYYSYTSSRLRLDKRFRARIDITPIE